MHKKLSEQKIIKKTCKYVNNESKTTDGRKVR